VGRRRLARGGVGRGEDIPTLRTARTRLATGAAAVACLLGLAALPLARGSGGVDHAGLRVVAVAVVALAAILVVGIPSLIPAPFVLVGAVYAAQLAVDDVPLDVAAPAFAAGLLVGAELAYWSLDERMRFEGEPGDDLRRLAYVAALGVGTLLVSSALLVLADALRTRGLGIDVLGAAAAALALLAVIVFARGRGTAGS
jgi:hypothetical protein